MKLLDKIKSAFAPSPATTSPTVTAAEQAIRVDPTQHIDVVALRSISYTGTTWINFLMASHDNGFYLGPPDRAWTLPPEHYRHACLAGRDQCAFWGTFFQSRDPDGKFIPQLHEYIGRKTIYIANPTKKFVDAELSSENIRLRNIYVVRDGRAVLFSLIRHVSQTYPDLVTGLKGWLFPAMRATFESYRKSMADSTFMRYEDVVADPVSALNRHADALGHRYTDQSLRFWEFEHHPTAGNIGPIDVYRRFRGMGEVAHKRADYYGEVFERAKTEPGRPIIDLSWQQKITKEESIAYDALLGELYEYIGYERERFDEAEVSAVAERHGFRDLNGYPISVRA